MSDVKVLDGDVEMLKKYLEVFKEQNWKLTEVMGHALLPSLARICLRLLEQKA